MGNNDWKNALLKSGLPLESAAARALVRRDFAVTNEYIFSRSDLGVSKDFSIDIEATKYFSVDTGAAEQIIGQLHLLVECKYRAPNTRWVFAADPNVGGFSPITLGGTIRTFDQISSVELPGNCMVPFDRNLNFTFRGIEYGHSSEGYDAEIRRGLTQLQYGLPRLLCELILHRLYNHPEDRKDPFFFAPILLTTAEIFVLKRNISPDKIREAESIEQVAKKVDYCVAFKDYGPDFERHCQQTFGAIYSSTSKELIDQIDAARVRKKPYGHSLESVLSGLENAERFFLRRYFDQFIVCEYSAFGRLVDRIIRLTGSTLTKLNS